MAPATSSLLSKALAAARPALLRAAKKKAPANPLLGRIDLTSYSEDQITDKSKAGDGLVVEISSSMSIGGRLYSISSGGSNRITLAEWSDPQSPRYLQQLNLGDNITTSVATFGKLVAIAVTPASYDAAGQMPSKSEIRFYNLVPPSRFNPSGSLIEVARVETGFLADGMRFSADGRKLFVANEGEPDSDFSQDPVGSVSIISISGSPLRPRFDKLDVAMPELNAAGLSLLGSGIRFSGKTGVTESFAQSAEPEYVSAAGGYLFATLQENNAVARINLHTNQVDAYIGLGWVDYSKLSIDLTDQDLNNGTAASNGFQPIQGQKVVGLRMADGIAAWQQGGSVYFLTANEGDARDYSGYLDERRDSSLGYGDVPGRLKLIVNNEKVVGLKDQALVLSGDLADANPTNDFGFESGTRMGTPVSFGSRSISLFDGITGELVWDSWMTDSIGGSNYNTSLQNIAAFAGIYDDGRSDDKGVEPESVVVVDYIGRRYAVAAMERTNAGDSLDQVTQGGLLAVYDVTDVRNVDFVTFQKVSRSPEGIEVIKPLQSPQRPDPAGCEQRVQFQLPGIPRFRGSAPQRQRPGLSEQLLRQSRPLRHPLNHQEPAGSRSAGPGRRGCATAPPTAHGHDGAGVAVLKGAGQRS